MKIKILLFVVLSLTGSFTFAQSFEGKVVYHNTYKSKNPATPDEQLTAMLGNKQEYVIKGGNYKSTMNGSMFQWRLYINKDNKVYSKVATSPVIFYNDGATNPDQAVKVEVNKNVIDVLGNTCHEVSMTTKNGFQKFYFSPKYKVDSKLYENFKFGNWYEYLSRSNAIPLKIVYDTPQFYMESVATEVTPMGVDDSLFVLPPDSQIQKSPF